MGGCHPLHSSSSVGVDKAGALFGGNPRCRREEKDWRQDEPEPEIRTVTRHLRVTGAVEPGAEVMLLFERLRRAQAVVRMEGTR